MKYTTEPLGDSDWNKQLLTAVDRTIEAWLKAIKEQEFEAAADYRDLAVHAIEKLTLGIPMIKSSVPRLINEDKPGKAAVNKHKILLEEGPKSYLKIVGYCGAKNDGLICLLGHGHIWLKNQNMSPRYLIGEIAAANGAFDDNHAGYVVAPNGVPNCGTGGSNYQGGRRFDTVEKAIVYLKKYFIVHGCQKNKTWTTDIIDKLKSERPIPPWRPKPGHYPKPNITVLHLPKAP